MPPEAIYLGLVRSVKPPPRYGFEYRTVLKDMTFVGLLESEYPIPYRSLSIRNTGNAADIRERLREWLERCRRHENCRARMAAAWSLPDGFRLFDTTSLRVLDASGREPYFALSHTWAQVDKVDILEQGESYSSNLSKVVQDLVGVVRALDMGVKHIWMDQLCVDQKPLDQRCKNISAMGAIYGASFATVILAIPSHDQPE